MTARSLFFSIEDIKTLDWQTIASHIKMSLTRPQRAIAYDIEPIFSARDRYVENIRSAGSPVNSSHLAPICAQKKDNRIGLGAENQAA